MKPKERFYKYALLHGSSCDRNSSPSSPPSVVKQADLPIDLSTKRGNSPITVHSKSPFSSSSDAHSISSSLSYNEWSTNRYLHANSNQAQTFNAPYNLLPYLLLNRSYYDEVPPTINSEISSKNSKNRVIYDRFCNAYGHDVVNGHDTHMLPTRQPIPTTNIDLCKSNSVFPINGQSPPQRSPTINTTSSSTSSTSATSSPLTQPSSNDYNETRRLLERSPTNSSFSNGSLLDNVVSKLHQRSHHNSNNNICRKITLRRSNSFPMLNQKSAKNKRNPRYIFNLVKSKSEDNIVKLIKKTEVISDVRQERRHERQQQNKPINYESKHHDSYSRTASNGHRVIERHESFTALRQQQPQYHPMLERDDFSSDQENEHEEAIESGISDDAYGSDDALDLRTTNLPNAYRPSDCTERGYPDPDRLFTHINALFINQSHSPQKEDVSSPASTPSPLDLYRQYYYYLMHQPAFASKAAVAMAETYAKLISSAAQNHETSKNNHNNYHDRENNINMNGSKYENRMDSPDYLLNGAKAELRSADTTNNGLAFDRKRISRPLTGKHVRHGTGASPATLVTLRNMIQERQRLKEIGVIPMGKFGKGKGKRLRRK